MLKQLTTGLLALTFLAGPVLAQGTCDEKKLSAAIDRYAAKPFSALTWRVLQGKGDPMIEERSFGGDFWSDKEEWRKLAEAILPGDDSLQNVDYDCRIGYPLSVLKRRIGSLGQDHAYVKQWLKAQGQVLAACSGEGEAAALPAPLEIEPAFANLQKMDRAYQEASIAFYRDKEKAIPLFRAIAESSSPHRAAARYNIANLLANAKQPDAARKEAEAILADPAMASVHAIARELLGYIANQEDTAEGWSRLIARNIEVLETPKDEIIADESLKREYASALYDIDFVGVRNKNGDWWLDGTLPEDPTISKALLDASRQYPMALWMMAGQSLDNDNSFAPWSLIGDKWQARTSSYLAKALAIQPSASGITGPALDMLKALAATPDDATRAALWSSARSAIASAQSSCGEAPETAAAGFLLSQATRLSAMAGKYDEAYQQLAAVPFKSASAFYDGAVYRMAQYLAGQGNAKEARALRDKFITADLLAAAKDNPSGTKDQDFARLLALIAEDESHWKQALQMQSDPAADIVFNLLPTKILWRLAEDRSFAEPDRALFARAAWTRDFALGRKLPDERTALLNTLNPKMADIARQVKTEFASARPDQLRLLTILRSPRHNILVAMPSDWTVDSIKPDAFDTLDAYDKNDKNWWCPLEPDRQLGAVRTQADWSLGLPDPDSYGFDSLKPVLDDALEARIEANRDAVLKAHPMVKAVDWKEVAKLAKMGSGPRQLTQAAIRWGKASKGSDGAPEALARAVEATHYGCSWHGSHEAYSKPAQLLLTTKFKDTKWAGQTPYWFGCTASEWDKDGNRVTVCTPKTWPKQKPLK